jgi:hypothetical protein
MPDGSWCCKSSTTVIAAVITTMHQQACGLQRLHSAPQASAYHTRGPLPISQRTPLAPQALALPTSVPAFGAHMARGARPYQEDAYRAADVLDLGSAGAGLAFSVFDGHGGSSVSSYCNEHLHDRLGGALAAACASGAAMGEPTTLAACLKAAFTTCDAELRDARRAELVGSTACTAVVTAGEIYTGCAGALGLCHGGL